MRSVRVINVVWLACRFFLIGDGLPFSPRRWALPITELRDTSPMISAISLAVRPAPQRDRSNSMRSSVQSAIRLSPIGAGPYIDAPRDSTGKPLLSPPPPISHNSFSFLGFALGLRAAVAIVRGLRLPPCLPSQAAAALSSASTTGWLVISFTTCPAPPAGRRPGDSSHNATLETLCKSKTALTTQRIPPVLANA